ncbi:hypothetical protein N7509_011028 [Penicillium cosmopolitanum]|uniref:Choline kinase N-terminal domain-containing protein n=1 Tax=Penicillium cosmopolitanum TaxID=1131564 RepID=A0A9W9VSG6_9EURO|nr:uncharacterized protein N7509_011028 [Penicillium cosmopolitanum]KAJ5388487.1 hypothetical protein N7509_011028 [Penicillium cosmopolitanum]
MPSALSSQSSGKLDPAQEDTEQAIKTDEDLQGSLFHQVSEWLQHEKVRRSTRKARRGEGVSNPSDGASETAERSSGEQHRSSESTFSLDRLESILHQYANVGHGAISRQTAKRVPRRRPKGLRRGSASESEYTDLEAPVPGVDASLDNSKTLAYSGGAGEEDLADSNSSLKGAKGREAWVTFKTEIVRLAHTLQLRGWRKVSMENAGDIEVVRLSGAMTNAIYVVGPPKNQPPLTSSSSSSIVPRKPPPKLLLRIYGPQVDHLIDREKELQILRRLGRKNIGPRVLGTFRNGRFEEYFEARPLTAKELRIPDTAKQIAKRMRELHDGIELLEEEREGGPMVFKNWDKWVDRCEKVTTWLDKELDSPQNQTKATLEPWRLRGYVCGVPWAVFRKAVDNYRIWLLASCGGLSEIKRQLVFAHNDPATQSPLLLPANEHKQLVVIDFEYSSANTPGFEFANHFVSPTSILPLVLKRYSNLCRLSGATTTTMKAGHGPVTPASTPKPEDQYRFVSTYLAHRPNIGNGATSPQATPTMRGRNATTITPLNLDDCPEPSGQQLQAERSNEEAIDAEIKFLMHQTRLWRVINSAQWVAWGIVQAKTPGMEEEQEEDVKTPTAETEAAEEEEEEFDYLAYSQDRALFFWSDLLALNLVKADDLPPAMVEHIRARAVDY